MLVNEEIVVVSVLAFCVVCCARTPRTEDEPRDNEETDFVPNYDALVTEEDFADLPKDIFNDTHNICANLRAIRDLIPSDTLRTLISEHYMNDFRFQNAMNFMRTASFQVAAARFANSNAYQQMLRQLKYAGVEVVDVENLIVIFNCISIEPLAPPVIKPVTEKPTPQPDMLNYALHMPEYDYEDYSWYPSVDTYSARSFQSFAMEILALLPRSALQNLITANLAKGTQFGNFYKTVRAPGFQRGFMRSLNSKQITAINRTFRRHSMDLRKLFVTFFRIVNTGPQPF